MASNESEDARSTMVASDSDAVDGSNDSAFNNKPKRPSRHGTVFWCLEFSSIFKGNLSQGTSTQQKARLLFDYLK
jgi:hypothetical protein